MIMANRDFLENRNINERNSLLDLVQNISPDSEEEVNFIDHSKYYNDQDYKDCLSRSKGALRILSLNCGGLNAKFDNLKIFLANCNNISFPIHVITLQETHINSNADIPYFELPGYTLVYDLARINSFGGVAIYVHDSFSFTRLDIDTFKQASSVYESMYLEIYNKDNNNNIARDKLVSVLNEEEYADTPITNGFTNVIRNDDCIRITADDGENAYFKIDLGAMYRIYSVIIYNYRNNGKCA